MQHINSCNSMRMTVVVMTTMQITSAVTTTVIGEAKIVALLVLSAILLGK